MGRCDQSAHSPFLFQSGRFALIEHHAPSMCQQGAGLVKPKCALLKGTGDAAARLRPECVPAPCCAGPQAGGHLQTGHQGRHGKVLRTPTNPANPLLSDRRTDRPLWQATETQLLMRAHSLTCSHFAQPRLGKAAKPWLIAAFRQNRFAPTGSCHRRKSALPTLCQRAIQDQRGPCAGRVFQMVCQRCNGEPFDLFVGR